MEFRWKVRSMLEKSKFSRPSMTTEELKAVNFLRPDQAIKILQAHKGNCAMVMDESKYKDKSNTLLTHSFMEPSPS
jgi:hypothetical protein